MSYCTECAKSERQIAELQQKLSEAQDIAALEAIILGQKLSASEEENRTLEEEFDEFCKWLDADDLDDAKKAFKHLSKTADRIISQQLAAEATVDVLKQQLQAAKEKISALESDRDCLIRSNQDAALDMVALDRKLTASEEQERGLREALVKIAAFDDEAAEMVLSESGSYSAFDEPGAVITARDALAALASTEEKKEPA